MNPRLGIQFGLGLFVLAALCGVLGFMIVYHYATYERPTWRFAIVIDAGSTQTRSNLFALQLDPAMLTNLNSRQIDQVMSLPTQANHTFSQLLQVRQIESCINGGPLANIQSGWEAQFLIHDCLLKFVMHIQQMNFEASDSNYESPSNQLDTFPEGSSHSITHLYFGATAGMRALLRLNGTRALEKLGWIEEALNRTQIQGINPAFVGIISGSDEAAYGWASVNFVCNQLIPNHLMSTNSQVNPADAISFHDSFQGFNEKYENDDVKQQMFRRSVGMLELGGASAQMAYEIAPNKTEPEGFQMHQIELLDQPYVLATRSDLCLGMSQALLRTNYILLRDLYDLVQRSATLAGVENDQIELANPCLQTGALLNLTRVNTRDLLQGACLVGSPKYQWVYELETYLAAQSMIRIRGTGQVDQCNELLANLLEPELCARYFALCPTNQNITEPPSGIAFVTVSGYNKALQVLNLHRSPSVLGQPELAGERMIAAQLGGFSVDHQELIQAINQFCTTQKDQLIDRYPTLNPAFADINCLQMIYINKLLTQYYHFKPESSWNQIKFLIFPRAPQPTYPSGLQDKDIHSIEMHQRLGSPSQDIGWTLGLLLNATSWQMSQADLSSSDLLFHHGASISFAIRATIFLMLACILLAISIIVIAMMASRHHHRKAYISYPTAKHLNFHEGTSQT